MKSKILSQWVAFAAIGISAAITLLALGIILCFIFGNGLKALNLEFLTGYPPSNALNEGGGGILPAIIGTLYLVLGSIAISLPIGVCAAIYLTEYTKEGAFTKIVRMGINNLAGVPSIVFGLFGYAFFCISLGRYFPSLRGPTMIAGQLTLAFMILPTIIRTAEEAIKSVPRSFREGSLALGATPWQTIRRVVLPPALPGIMTGAILGVGRVAGETAPIMFCSAVFWQGKLPSSIFQPVMALSYHLYELASSGGYLTRSNQWGTAVVLLGLVFAINLVAIVIRSHYAKMKKW